MADIAELHAQALEHTGRIVAGIPADRWQSATPCDGWDVRALLNHLVAGNLWAAELAAGAPIRLAPMQRPRTRPRRCSASPALWTRHARCLTARCRARSTRVTGSSMC